MKDIYTLIRQREAEIERIQRELEALRLSARLLEEDSRPVSATAASVPTTVYNAAPTKPQAAATATPTPAAWASAKQFP